MKKLNNQNNQKSLYYQNLQKNQQHNQQKQNHPNQKQKLNPKDDLLQKREKQPHYDHDLERKQHAPNVINKSQTTRCVTLMLRYGKDKHSLI